VEITKEQTSLAARKQELSKELRKVMTEGQRVAALLKRALQEHLGPTSEQLTAFQIQPFRGRKLKKKEIKETSPLASGPASQAL
jgi:F0F1-type ATP synthase alpha subunit